MPDNKPSVLEVIKRARQIIDKGWTKGEYARDSQGRRFAPSSPDACEFCAIGGLRRAYFEITGESAHDAHVDYAVEQILPDDSAPAFKLIDMNDLGKTRKEDVLGWFDKTIARLEQEAQNA